MSYKRKTLMTLILLLLMAGCGRETETLDRSKESPKQRSSSNMEQSFAAGEQKFALALFHEIIKQEGTSENVLISPYSVQQALAMTANGARGDSRTEILDTLYLHQMNISDINKTSKSLLQSFQSLPNGELSAANSVWSKREIKKSFIDRITGLGNAYQLDQDPKQAADQVNGWVSKKTKGRIDRIIDDVGPDILAYIINTVYFKESWKEEFDQHLTVDQPFYSPAGSAKKHPMMTQTNRFPYLQNKHFQAVKLPYKDERLSLAVFLPEKTENLQSFLKRLTYQNWRRWQAGWKMKQVELKLPKFSFETEAILNTPLKKLGMRTVFQQADFSNLFAGKDEAYINEVKHNTFIKVNEAGTEAAAATKVEIVESASVPDVVMTADRPFYFAVMDEKTGIILFLGSVVDPAKD
ncbi:serpin family protein [Bacillus swezeyi]|uniref:serpin family protein n=1 Tax=Bacillus swezeyi TaxID=1925020 RepID=UPI002E1C15B0|nr:serpin family protein [Bacillus swezeyi]MED2976447.1 serpin family protein [Bacillus swezeyi]